MMDDRLVVVNVFGIFLLLFLEDSFFLFSVKSCEVVLDGVFCIVPSIVLSIVPIERRYV